METIFFPGLLRRKAKRFGLVGSLSLAHTQGLDNAGVMKKFIFSFLVPVMLCVGVMHPLEVGAQRNVDALIEKHLYRSGMYYASTSGTTGPVCDQSILYDAIKNRSYQDNAFAAVECILLKA